MSNKRMEVRRLAKERKHKQRTWLILALGGVVLIVTALLLLQGNKNSQGLAAIEVTGAPSLKVDQEQVDLGDKKLGSTVKVSFLLTNVGDQPLRFSKQPYVEVVEGCWPPTPTIGSMVLQPGKTTTLSIEFMMHGDMGGQHNFLLHLPTNDPKNPDHNLTVLSNWIPWEHTSLWEIRRDAMATHPDELIYKRL